jgi:hypothetical protein
MQLLKKVTEIDYLRGYSINFTISSYQPKTIQQYAIHRELSQLTLNKWSPTNG